MSYMIPIPNVQINCTFLVLATFNPHSIGMGKTTSTTSSRRFKTAVSRSSAFTSLQVPVMIFGDHLNVIGRQMRQFAMIALAPKATFTARTV